MVRGNDVLESNHHESGARASPYDSVDLSTLGSGSYNPVMTLSLGNGQRIVVDLQTMIEKGTRESQAAFTHQEKAKRFEENRENLAEQRHLSFWGSGLGAITTIHEEL